MARGGQCGVAEQGEPRLSNKALVIRGGEMSNLQHMQDQAVDEYCLNGRYALSVGADETMSLRELAMANRRPNRKIRKTTVGRLRAAGFEVTYPTGTKRHADLILPTHPTDGDWVALIEAFDNHEPNPYYYEREGEVNQE